MRTNNKILPLEVSRLNYEINGHKLIENLNFKLDTGQISVFLGPNGAGKSLTLKLCHGILKPSSGNIIWSSDLSEKSDETRQSHTMVFQKPILLRRSVRANIEHTLKVCKIPKNLRADILEKALAKTGLDKISNLPAKAISGGEQQKLAMARAWALSPKVLFLDEPTTNLDPSATISIENLIKEFHKAGTKIIMTTHDLRQAQRLSNEILFFHSGRLLEQTESDKFFANPKTKAARAFIKGELFW